MDMALAERHGHRGMEMGCGNGYGNAWIWKRGNGSTYINMKIECGTRHEQRAHIFNATLHPRSPSDFQGKIPSDSSFPWADAGLVSHAQVDIDWCEHLPESTLPL